uniref:Uncharacterized protein n=1 Tax=Laticauda laticaudata TaxID=8630 RepID=A0A8C5S007_LATLA
RIENGRMTEHLEWYKPFPKWEGQTIDFHCDHGFVSVNQQTWQRATCINSHFVPEPKCFRYSPANQQSTITCTKKGWSPAPECMLAIGGKCGPPPPWRMETFCAKISYTMEGSPRVTCQNSHWSQPPTCRVACTANEEDMRVYNIKLRWSNRNKIYSEDGSREANCVDGKFDYPTCSTFRQEKQMHRHTVGGIKLILRQLVFGTSF